MNKKRQRHRVAVVYHYWASYREPIAKLLSSSRFPNPEYCLFSGVKTDRPIKTIDPSLINFQVGKGGLKWKILPNFWFLKYFLWQRGIIRLALSKEFDTIIYLGQMYFVSTWLSAIIARLNGKRVLMWTHGFIQEEKNLKGFIRALFYRIADGLLLYGNHAKKILLKKGFDSNRLYIVYNSLDYDLQREQRNTVNKKHCQELRRSLFQYDQLPILFFIGRLTRQKKLSQLTEATKLLHERGCPVNVLFIGDGPESKTLQRFVDANDLSEYVTFYGACHKEKKLAPLIMMSDVCVSPGEVGLTAMHSLAYGKPVITHDDHYRQMPEYEAIIPFKTGAFFKYDSVEDMANVIKQWLSLNIANENISFQCINVIEKYYNPYIQLSIFNAAVDGVTGDELQNIICRFKKEEV